jgi:hypothetical protein
MLIVAGKLAMTSLCISPCIFGSGLCLLALPGFVFVLCHNLSSLHVCGVATSLFSACGMSFTAQWDVVLLAAPQQQWLEVTSGTCSMRAYVVHIQRAAQQAAAVAGGNVRHVLYARLRCIHSACSHSAKQRLVLRRYSCLARSLMP